MANEREEKSIYVLYGRLERAQGRLLPRNNAMKRPDWNQHADLYMGDEMARYAPRNK